MNADEIWSIVDAKAARFVDFSDRVWGMPELKYAEFRSAAEHVQMLEEEGFAITPEVAGIATAMTGEAGEGGPLIAILGEYDALPALSQEAGIAEPLPLEAGGNGHGCGHNLLGAAAMLAAAAVKDYLAEKGIPGRVRYYGCPAEEGGAAKAFMVREGAFEGVDAAICWHPGAFARVDTRSSLTRKRVEFSFKGRASHAAASPELGRSALDAVELMSVGVNYLREHMPPGCRLHYAYQDAGGIAPNVVQAQARVLYTIRATNPTDRDNLVERVSKVARGAALMTETEVKIEVLSGVSSLLGNTPLQHAMQANLSRLGPPQFDEADRDFARRIQGTLSPEHVRTAFAAAGMPYDADRPLADIEVPFGAEPANAGQGSTDVGDVSWVVPTVQARGATMAIGTALHTWQTVAQGKSPAAHKGMVHIAKVMAATALDLLQDGELLERAKADLQEKTAQTPYRSPLPEGVPVPKAVRENA